MIVVKVELHSAITGQVTELARAHISNVGGDTQHGDYKVDILRGRCTEDLDRRTILKTGSVLRHPRLREHVWNLVTKGLNNLGYGKEKR